MLKHIFYLLVLFSFFSCSTKTTNKLKNEFTAKVVGVKDGDTIEVLKEDNTTTVVRFADIDCPEKNSHSEQKQNSSFQIFAFQKT